MRLQTAFRQILLLLICTAALIPRALAYTNVKEYLEENTYSDLKQKLSNYENFSIDANAHPGKRLEIWINKVKNAAGNGRVFYDI